MKNYFYEKITAQEATDNGLTNDQYNAYNKQVDILNNTIDQLNALNKEYGLESASDLFVSNLSVQNKDAYNTAYQKLYHEHCQAYEIYMDLQEDMILNSAKEDLGDDDREDI